MEVIRQLKKLSGKILFTNPWWKYKLDAYELPNGEPGEYHYVETPGSVMVIPLHEDGSVTFVRQYRYLNQRVSLELPGGGLIAGTDPADMARDELREEAGLVAGELLRLGEHNPWNGVTSELCQVFLATGLSAVENAPDETEEFEIVRLTPSQYQRAIADGGLWDGMTLAALQLFSIHEGSRG